MSFNRLPPLKSLYAFRYAATYLSFKEAAERLNVTQAAISQQIKTLEQTLGIELFERHTRQVVLTSEGHYLFEYTVKAFDLLEAGVKGITEDQNPNTLVISTIPSFASRWLVSRLGRFQEQEKDINIQLNPSIGLSSFTDSQLDLAIRFGQGQYEGLHSELLFKDFLLPICHPSLIDVKQPVKPQLAQLPVITDDGPDMTLVWPILQKELGATNIPINSHLHISDSTILIEALLSGQGITMTRFSLVYQLIKNGQLICPLPIHLKSFYNFYLVAPAPHFKHQKVIKFRRWIEEEVKEIKYSWQVYLTENPHSKEVQR